MSSFNNAIKKKLCNLKKMHLYYAPCYDYITINNNNNILITTINN